MTIERTEIFIFMSNIKKRFEKKKIEMAKILAATNIFSQGLAEVVLYLRAVQSLLILWYTRFINLNPLYISRSRFGPY